MRSIETNVAVLPAEAADVMPDAAHAQLVTILSIAADGLPLVSVDDDNPVVTARLAVRTTMDRVQRAIAQRQPAVVLFERGDRSRPIIVGFLEQIDEQPASSTAAAGGTAGRADVLSTSDAPTTHPDEPRGMPFIEADVDGRRVRLTAQDEIVLQCGSASVTLRRNGRVVIRGAYVETHSEGTNRIKGGQVQIN